MKAKIFFLLLGIAVGLAAALLMPRLWLDLMPQEWKGEPTAGTVQAKRWEQDRLLLTVVTPEGAVLATFTRKVSEIELLVEAGDTVHLDLRGYRPFVEDPEIVRVIKAPEETVAPPLPDPPVVPAAPEQVEEPQEVVGRDTATGV